MQSGYTATEHNPDTEAGLESTQLVATEYIAVPDPATELNSNRFVHGLMVAIPVAFCLWVVIGVAVWAVSRWH